VKEVPRLLKDAGTDRFGGGEYTERMFWRRFFSVLNVAEICVGNCLNLEGKAFL